jgi:hypothetical protein
MASDHKTITFGSGECDYHGFFEYPCVVCARHWDFQHPKGTPSWPPGNECDYNSLWRVLGWEPSGPGGLDFLEFIGGKGNDKPLAIWFTDLDALDAKIRRVYSTRNPAIVDRRTLLLFYGRSGKARVYGRGSTLVAYAADQLEYHSSEAMRWAPPDGVSVLNWIESLQPHAAVWRIRNNRKRPLKSTINEPRIAHTMRRAARYLFSVGGIDDDSHDDNCDRSGDYGCCESQRCRAILLNDPDVVGSAYQETPTE